MLRSYTYHHRQKGFIVRWAKKPGYLVTKRVSEVGTLFGQVFCLENLAKKFQDKNHNCDLFIFPRLNKGIFQVRMCNWNFGVFCMRWRQHRATPTGFDESCARRGGSLSSVSLGADSEPLERRTQSSVRVWLQQANPAERPLREDGDGETETRGKS